MRSFIVNFYEKNLWLDFIAQKMLISLSTFSNDCLQLATIWYFTDVNSTFNKSSQKNGLKPTY